MRISIHSLNTLMTTKKIRLVTWMKLIQLSQLALSNLLLIKHWRMTLIGVKRNSAVRGGMMISAPLHNVTTALGNFVLFLTTLIGKKKGSSRRALPCTTAKRMNVLPIGIRCFVSRLTASKITSLTSPFTKIGCLTFVPMALVNYVSMTLIARLSSLAHSKKKKISLKL